MATSGTALRRIATSLFFRRVTPAASSFFATRSFSDGSQVSRVTNQDHGSVELDRRAGRQDYPPAFFADVVDPFFPTRSLSQVLNMMDSFTGTPFYGPTRAVGSDPTSRRGWDVKEDEKALYIKMDMPGLGKEDVKVSVDQNTLVIKGEGPQDTEDEDKRRYSSRLDLSPNVYKVDKIKAEMRNGVLKVVVPKVQEEKRSNVREVEIT